MFDRASDSDAGDGTAVVPERLDARALRTWAGLLAGADKDVSDAERIDLIRALEELKCVSEAAQATISADFDASQRAEQADRGVLAARRGRGVAEQIALARRESPHRGRQHLGLAKILRKELPHTLAAFASGRITEWKATLVARETACLNLEDRLRVDAALAGNPERIEAMGDGELVGEARKLAYELDAASFVQRRRRAEADRRVTLRAAPDVMSQLSAVLPMKDGVAVYAVLSREADRLRVAGDDRSRGQLMADTLVRRVLAGDSSASGAEPAVMIHLVVSDRVLFGDSGEAGYVAGYGPVPADLARELAGTPGAWLRGLYVRPATRSAAPRGVAPRSGTTTTSRLSSMAARPAHPTARGCARPATTPRKRPGGPPGRDPGLGTLSKPPRRRATATSRPVPHSPRRVSWRPTPASGPLSPDANPPHRARPSAEDGCDLTHLRKRPDRGRGQAGCG